MIKLFRPLNIYLDSASTTRIDKRVLAAMKPYLGSYFANPHSTTHVPGLLASKAVEDARDRVSKIISCHKDEIIFTSGATEANNLALRGVMKFYGKDKPHMITSQIEHKSVLGVARSLEEEGYKVSYLPVDSNGQVNLNDLKKAITPKTALVSIMTINNETGAMQRIRQIGQLCRENNVFFHTDAAQAVGKVPLDVKRMNIDMMSISSHKIHGPKGIGALYLSKKPRIRLTPIMYGGGQERGLRPGTIPTALAVGFGMAVQVARLNLSDNFVHISNLSERLVKKITEKVPKAILNCKGIFWYPGIVNMSFKHIEGESLLLGLKGIHLSSGSACTSKTLEPSYVLRASKMDDALAHSSIRFGISKDTTAKEIDICANKVAETVKRLREMSPLWEMEENGLDVNKIDWKKVNE